MPPPASTVSPADITDERLGRQALAGDRAAFTELFTRHESGVYNVAYRLTGNREDAADITQESFLRVFARLDDLAGREVNLAAYLHRTARNLVYDRSAHREAPSDRMEVMAGADETLDADPELTTLVSAQGDDVRAANARLPERHRLVLALRELEDMSYEDIGRVLDITAGAVGQVLARARLALRRELRLQHVDVEAMAPDCRARLGDIGSLIDGELDVDRTHVLTQHLSACAACRDAQASFENARVTYRAWLPLPILALGSSTARAAEGRGLVRFTGSARRAGAVRRAAGVGPGAGGFFGGHRRAWASVGGGVLGALLLFGAPTIVAIRSGSNPPPPPSAAPATTSTTARPGATPAPPPAATPTTTTLPAPAAPAAAPPVAAPRRTPAAPPPPPAASTRSRRAPSPPPAAAPRPATNAGGPATDAPAAPDPVVPPPATPPPAPVEPTPPPREPQPPPTDPPPSTTPPPRPPNPDIPTFFAPIRTIPSVPTRPVPPSSGPPPRVP